jgi:hypothetical protein
MCAIVAGIVWLDKSAFQQECLQVTKTARVFRKWKVDFSPTVMQYEHTLMYITRQRHSTLLCRGEYAVYGRLSLSWGAVAGHWKLEARRAALW